MSLERYTAGLSDYHEEQNRPRARYPSLPRCKPDKDPVLGYPNAISWFSLPLQHFKPSQRDAQARCDLLDQLIKILSQRFGSGFDLEYVGIGRYAVDIKQAPIEVAIIVRISSLVPFRR